MNKEKRSGNIEYNYRKSGVSSRKDAVAESEAAPDSGAAKLAAGVGVDFATFIRGRLFVTWRLDTLLFGLLCSFPAARLARFILSCFNPRVDVWTSDAHPWDRMNPALPKFEKYPK